MAEYRGYLPYLVAAAVLLALPLAEVQSYYMHVLIQILIWGFIYTAWSIMGRFGLVSLGHGAFMGVGAYTVAMLWNSYQLTPWIGIPVALALAAALALVIGYPCCRFRIVGHYFALVTLALSEVVLLTVVALREHTGGSLGLTPFRHGEGASLYALQFPEPWPSGRWASGSGSGSTAACRARP
jgi:branched-chain amino acid transport system permease protein